VQGFAQPRTKIGHTTGRHTNICAIIRLRAAMGNEQ
jgi:hypothetical protein